MSLPVTLTPGNIGLVCYPDDPQTLADAIINNASGQLEFEIGGIVYKNIDDGEPDPAYRGTALWFETKNRQFFWWSTTLAKWVLVHDPALYNVTAGTGLAYTLDLTAWSFESIAALTGFPIVIKAHAANTGAATLQVDAFAATAIKQYKAAGIADLDAANIVVDGVYIVVYDGTQFVLLNPTPAAPVAPVLSESYAGPLTALPADFFAITQAHGLSSVPKVVRAVLVCVTAEKGYAVNDEVDLLSFEFGDGSNNDATCAITANATNVIITSGSGSITGGNAIYIIDKTSDAWSPITRASWNLKIYAFA